MVLCATLLVRRGAGVAMRTVASQAKRKNAPAQAQGVFETLNREARPTVRLLDLTEGAPVPYATCTDLQTRLVDECIDGARDALVLVEHPHVYTLGAGRRARARVVRRRGAGRARAAPGRARRRRDVPRAGQLVAYPILNLHNYKRDSHGTCGRRGSCGQRATRSARRARAARRSTRACGSRATSRGGRRRHAQVGDVPRHLAELRRRDGPVSGHRALRPRSRDRARGQPRPAPRPRRRPARRARAVVEAPPRSECDLQRGNCRRRGYGHSNRFYAIGNDRVRPRECTPERSLR